MPLIHSKKLSHVALHAQDVQAQTEFYTNFVGLQESARDAQGNVYLRCNADHHALLLKPASAPGFDHFALDLGGPDKLDAAARALDQAGMAYQTVPTGTELGQPDALRLLDPDGFVVELLSGLTQCDPTYGPRVVQPRRFGHITLRVADPKRTADFYTHILGFRISDWLGEDFVWMRCTPEHHGIAVSRHTRAPMVHHISFHVRDINELIQQAEHLMRHNRTLLYGPGRHGPGQNLFIYFKDTESMIVEYAADMQRIWDEESYQPKIWDPNQRWSNMWGPPSLPEFRA